MQILTVIVPLSRTTSNIALSCRDVRDWVSNNGFPIKTVKELSLENWQFYRDLECPDINEWMADQMLASILEDNVNKLKALLAQGVEVDLKDTYNRTGLIWAAKKGKLKTLKLLLEHKADLKATDRRRRTALLMAASYGRVNCLKVLLEEGADVEDGTHLDVTPLMMAAKNGHAECLRLLLQGKADINRYCHFYGTGALGEAVTNHHTDCIKLLLEHGARVNFDLRRMYPQYADLWGDSIL